MITSTAASRWRAWAALGLGTFLAFAITFRDGFGSDDFGWIAWARAATPRDVLGAFKLWTPRHEMPLMYVAFYGLFHAFGVATWGYRVVSIGLHIIAVVLVYEIGRRIIDRPGGGLLAAALFAVQPAHSQAVAWDAAVQHLLATASYLTAVLAFMAYLETERRALYGATLAALLVSLLSKEESVSLPLVLFLSEFLLYRRRSTVRRLVKYAPMAAILAGYLLVRLTFAQRSNLVIAQHYALGWQMLGKLWDYATALAFPLPEPFGQRVMRAAPSVRLVRRGAAIGIVLVLAGVALLGPSRSTSGERSAAGRRVAFTLSWMVLATLPFLPFTWGMQSRYAYLPAVPFSILTALAVAAAWGEARRTSARLGVAAAVAATLAVYVGFTVFNERSPYVTGVLSMSLMNEVKRSAPRFTPGTTVILVDSPMDAQTARPIFAFSHPDSVRNLRAVVNVSKDSPEHRAAAKDPSALVLLYEEGRFRGP